MNEEPLEDKVKRLESENRRLHLSLLVSHSELLGLYDDYRDSNYFDPESNVLIDQLLKERDAWRKKSESLEEYIHSLEEEFDYIDSLLHKCFTMIFGESYNLSAHCAIETTSSLDHAIELYNSFNSQNT